MKALYHQAGLAAVLMFVVANNKQTGTVDLAKEEDGPIDIKGVPVAVEPTPGHATLIEGKDQGPSLKGLRAKVTNATKADEAAKAALTAKPEDEVLISAAKEAADALETAKAALATAEAASS